MKSYYDNEPLKLEHDNDGTSIFRWNIEQAETGWTCEEIRVTDATYNSLVVALIRDRYSIDDEIGINRQKESKPGEFQEYFDYCEWCKNEAAS